MLRTTVTSLSRKGATFERIVDGASPFRRRHGATVILDSLKLEAGRGRRPRVRVASVNRAERATIARQKACRARSAYRFDSLPAPIAQKPIFLPVRRGFIDPGPIVRIVLDAGRRPAERSRSLHGLSWPRTGLGRARSHAARGSWLPPSITLRGRREGREADKRSVARGTSAIVARSASRHGREGSMISTMRPVHWHRLSAAQRLRLQVSRPRLTDESAAHHRDPRLSPCAGASELAATL